MSRPHSVIFCGTPTFAVPSLTALAEDAAFTVSLVVTQPDKPAGRSRAPRAPAVKDAALSFGLPLFQPASLNHELLPFLRERAIDAPDFLVVVAYGQILSTDILTLPRIAPVNVHASLLPRWRGASPIEHALLAGDTHTGVTIQRMVRALDAGPILTQDTITIDTAGTSVEVRDTLSRLGAILLARTLKAPLRETPQDDELVTFCRKLSREDGRADPERMNADEIDRRVRALVPWPGVMITVDGQSLKLLKTSLIPHQESTPLICQYQTTLYLVTVQPPGKKPMSGAEWRRGRSH